MIKKKIIYSILVVVLFLLIYIIGSKCYYGEIYYGIGNEEKRVWDTEELTIVSKDFELQNDEKFLSMSPDPWFDIVESFQVRTIMIDISEISEQYDSQVFYYSDDQNLDEKFSYYFRLKKGINCLQIPNGNYNKFRLDLTDHENVTLGVKSITTYGNRCISSRFLIAIVVLWGILIKIIYNWMFKEKKYGKFLLESIISLELCFMLFFYAPLELFFSNRNEFWFDIYTLLPVLVIVFLVFSVIIIGVLAIMYFINIKLYQFGLIACFITFICSYIQGNFMISNLPPLDGTTVDWNQYIPERIASVILWIVVTVVVLLAIKFLQTDNVVKAINFIGGGMTLMLVITIISICVTNEGYKKKLDLLITNANQYEMSTNSNFIILLLDALDARALTALMESEPEVKNIFSDFTYYPNTVGGYTFTENSIPFIFSGDWYENDEPFEEYNMNVYKTAKIFSELERRSYKMGLYGSIPLEDEVMCRFDNIQNGVGKIKSILSFVKLEIRLAGVKYAPFELKKYCLFDVNQFNELRIVDNHSMFNFSNLIFYDEVNNKDITFTNDNCFKFIHLEGAHVPFQYDKNLNIVENGTYEGNVEACATITRAYLDKLKENGVYDNSVIIVMSDHGFDGYELEDTLARHNPAFLVKGINEKHDMYVSNAPIAYEDLQEAYIRLLEGCNSMEIFDWKEGDERERRYLFYYYLQEDHMEEYMIKGNAADESSLIPTGREFNYE